MKHLHKKYKVLPILSLLFILFGLNILPGIAASGHTSRLMPANGASLTDLDFDQTFTHHTLQVNDVRLHYVIGGKGTPLVLLHGFPATWYEWHRIMPALAEHYTVIAPDLRGLGDSSRPPDGYDKRTAADDIYKLVSQLGFKSILLVGHDIGGMVAYAYAAQHADQVQKLAILDVPIPGPFFEQLPLLQRGGNLAWHFGFQNVTDLPEYLVAGKEREYLSYFYHDLSYNPAAIDQAEIDQYVRSYSSPGGMRAGFEYYRAFFKDIDDNKVFAQTKLKMPVLALSGVTSPANFEVEQLKPLADNVTGGTVPQAGHWIAEEQPAYLTQQLLTFFDGPKK